MSLHNNDIAYFTDVAGIWELAQECAVFAVALVLASRRKFIEDRFPFRGDGEIALSIRHRHPIREHDGATHGMELIFGPPRRRSSILAAKLEPENMLQTTLGNETAEFSEEGLEAAHVNDLKVAILVGLERSFVVDEIVDPSEVVAV